MKQSPILGITMGDVCGIGPEIAVKALLRPETYDICHPIIVGDTLPVFEYVSLEGTDSTFYYCFQLTDIFGETELSDFIEFEM